METNCSNCLVVEKCDNGRLVLHQENLKHLSDKIVTRENKDSPIFVASVVGPRRSGVTLLTNILGTYLEEKKQWYKLIDNFGTGFAFHECNQEDSLLVPDDSKSGIYLWPKLHHIDHVNGKVTVWIMHGHFVGENLEEDILKQLMTLISSTLIQIVLDVRDDEDDIKTKTGLESSSNPYLHITTLRRHQLPENYRKKRGTFFLPDIMPKFEDSRYKASHIRTLQSLLGHATEGSELKPKTYNNTPLKVETLPLYLNELIEKLNSKVNFTTMTRRNSYTDATTQPKCKTESPTESKSKNNIRKKLLPASNDMKTSALKPSKVDHCNFTTPTTPETQPRQDSNRSGLSDLANIMLSERPIWQMLQHKFEIWVDKSLNKFNCNSILNQLDQFVVSIVSEEVQLMLKENKIERVAISFFTEIASKLIKEKYASKFKIIEHAINNFCLEVDAEFRKSSCFQIEVLKCNLDAAKTKIIESVKREDIKPLIITGCIKIYPDYIKYNERRQNISKVRFNECILQVSEFYAEEMNSIFQCNLHVHPKILQRVHEILYKQLCSIVEEQFKHDSNISTYLEVVSKKMSTEYDNAVRRNFSEIENAQRNVINLTTKIKSQFELELESFLSKHSEGTSTSEFKITSINAMELAEGAFRREVVKLVPKNVYIEEYVNVLKIHINKTKEVFERENDRNRVESEQRRIESSQIDVTPKAEKLSIQSSPVTSQKKLEPLLFHLSLSKYGVAYCNGMDIEIEYKPGMASLTSDEEWIVGHEVSQHLSEKSACSIRSTFCLTECFSSRCSKGNVKMESWKDVISDSSSSYEVNAEFILAIILQREKMRIEEMEKGKMISVYICVPFWFPSYQRQQVVDSAKLAGFEDVRLFNENTVSAYFMYYSNLHTPGENTVVICESSSRLDISFYGYDSKQKKVLTIGHAGDYECNINDSKDHSWFSTLATLIQSYWRAEEPTEEHKAVKATLSQYDRAFKMAKNSPYFQTSKKKKILICCETDSWAIFLTRVTEKIADIDGVTIQHNAAMHGLASLSNAMEDHGNATKTYVQDGMPFYVNIYSPKRFRINVIDKRGTFSVSFKNVFSCNMTAQSGTFEICQENDSGRYPIGYVVLPSSITGSVSMNFTLVRSNDNIIYLKTLKSAESRYPFTTHILDFSPTGNVWKSHNLTELQARSYKDILYKIQSSSSAEGKLVKTKADLRTRCESILLCMSQGKGQFPVDLVKSMVEKKVQQIITSMDQMHTLDDVSAKMDVLNNFSLKYHL